MRNRRQSSTSKPFSVRRGNSIQPKMKIRIVLEGLRGEQSIAELCRREQIAQSLYYAWSKEFLEVGKKRLSGDVAREATCDEVKQLRRETSDLKEVLAETLLESRLLKST